MSSRTGQQIHHRILIEADRESLYSKTAQSSNISKITFHPLFREKITFFASTITQPTKIQVTNIFRSTILTKIIPFLTARYTILCTPPLQPPHDECAVQVQWFSRVNTISVKSKLFLHLTLNIILTFTVTP